MTEVLRGWFILALSVFLAGLVLWVLILFLREMVESKQNSRPGVWIEANWGGLGGGLSGWRVSNAIIYLLVLSLLLGCLSLTVVSLTPALKPADSSASGKDLKKSPNAPAVNKAAE